MGRMGARCWEGIGGKGMQTVDQEKYREREGL